MSSEDLTSSPTMDSPTKSPTRNIAPSSFLALMSSNSPKRKRIEYDANAASPNAFPLQEELALSSLPINDGSTIMNGLLSQPILEMNESENGNPFLYNIPNDSSPSLLDDYDSLDINSDIQIFLNGYQQSFIHASWEDVRNIFTVKYNLKQGQFQSIINNLDDKTQETWRTIRSLKIKSCSRNMYYGEGYIVHDIIGSIESVHLISLIQDLSRKERGSIKYKFTGLKYTIGNVFWNENGLPDVILRINLADKDKISLLYHEQFTSRYVENEDIIEFYLHHANGNLRSYNIHFPRDEIPTPTMSFKARNNEYFIPFEYFSDQFANDAPRPTVSDFQENVTKINLINMDSITDFFRMIINKKGKCISIRNTSVLDAFSLYFKNLLDEFTLAFDEFCEDPSPINLSALNSSFIYLNTIPSYLSLFPENKWSKLKSGQIIKYMAHRWESFLRIKNKEDPILEIRNEDFFNRPRSFVLSRKSSIKAAAKAASESLLSKSYDILHRAFNVTAPSEPPAETKYEELRKLHPLSDDLQDFNRNHSSCDEEEESQIHFFPDEIIDFFKKAKEKGSAPGPDGLSAETILMLIMHNGDQSNSFLKSLSAYFQRLTHPKIPKEFWQILTTARLFGITKPDGVSQRPLANGLLFRKAIGAISLKKFSTDITKALGPHQLGIAVTLGTEKIGHIFDHLFQDSNSFFIKTDFANAFNSFSRSAALHALLDQIPKLGAIVYKFYGISNTLLYENMEPMSVNMGSQQGCPLGPLLFCFAFKSILDQLQLEYPECYLKAYVDDVTIAIKNNNIEEANNFLNSFESCATEINLQLNIRKCKIMVPDQTKSTVERVAIAASLDLQKAITDEDATIAYKSTIDFLQDRGFDNSNIVFNNEREDPSTIGMEVLGFPIGTKEFKIAFFENIANKYMKEAACIRNLQHYQSEWSLFLYCLQSKISHLLRVIHPSITIPIVAKIIQYDSRLLMNIFDLNGLNNDIKQKIGTQFFFKVSEGGFNKKNYNHTAISAYLGSALTCYSYVKSELNKFIPLQNNSEWLVNCSTLLCDFRKIYEGEGVNMMANDYTADHFGHIESFLSSLLPTDHQGNISNFNFKKLQKRFSEILYQRITKNFEKLPDGNRLDATRRTNQFYSGKWLLLSPAPGTYIENAAFRIAIALKLNLDLIGPNHKCFHCKSPVDVKGHHFLSCNCAGLKQCHDNVRNVIADFLKRLGYTVFVGELPINALNGIPPREEDDLELFRPVRQNSTHSSYNNTSTAGTRVDILATKPGSAEKPIYMDVQIINSVAPSFTSLESKEAIKEHRHKAAVEAQNGQYWTPTFDCFGNPSKKTEKMIKSLYETYLASLPANSKALMLAEGRQINYWLTKISFCINHMKAYKTLMLLNDLKGNIMGKVDPKDILEHQSAQNLMRQASI